MKTIVLLCLICLPAFCLAQSDTSKKHIRRAYPKGVIIDEPIMKLAKDTTICDKVFSSHFFSGSQTTHLDLGSTYPNGKYIIVIGGRSRGKFKEPPEIAFKGKHICVTGKIESQKLIFVNDPSQIVIE